MMHEQTMQRDGGRGDTDYAADPSPGSGNRNTDAQDTGPRGFYNDWDGGGAGGAHVPRENGAGSQSQGRENQGGTHAGRGPKGYQRSDARISEDVHRALTDDDMLDATHIEVEVNGGDVTLSGTVASRGDKRRAETLLDHIVGMKDVHNRITVTKES